MEYGTATSADGTRIPLQRAGDGVPVVLIGGALDDGTENGPLAEALARSHTVLNYARRGRGDSGDVQPYALEREVEDLAALLDGVGGSAHLVGISSGGALALEAAAAGIAVRRLAVYEVPYLLGPLVEAWRTYRTQLAHALAEDRPDDALELFMRLAGSSDDDIAGAKLAPVWAELRRLAPTLAYDAACIGDGPPPIDRLARVRQPTLVLTGATLDPAMGGLAPGFFDDAADAVVAAMPDARRHVIEVSGHVPDPARLAPALIEFFAE